MIIWTGGTCGDQFEPAVADFGIAQGAFFTDLSTLPTDTDEYDLAKTILSHQNPLTMVIGWHSYCKVCTVIVIVGLAPPLSRQRPRWSAASRAQQRFSLTCTRPNARLNAWAGTTAGVTMLGCERENESGRALRCKEAVALMPTDNDA